MLAYRSVQRDIEIWEQSSEQGDIRTRWSGLLSEQRDFGKDCRSYNSTSPPGRLFAHHSPLTTHHHEISVKTTTRPNHAYGIVSGIWQRRFAETEVSLLKTMHGLRPGSQTSIESWIN